MQRHRSQEVSYVQSHTEVERFPTTFFLTLASTSLLDHLCDPDTDADARMLRYAQRACGRWLALRRARLGLANTQIIRQTGMSAEALMRLELGLATPEHVSAEAFETLGGMLADAGDGDLTTAVAALASGHHDDPDGVVVERVMADLEALIDALDD